LTKFEPTETQRNLLEVFKAEDYDVTVTDACKSVGISRETYYNWMEIGAFREWWMDRAEHHFTLLKTSIFSATHKAATSEKSQPRGSSADRKLFLERFDKDYMPKSRKDINHAGAMPVKLEEMSTEELERMAHAAGLRDATETEYPDPSQGVRTPHPAPPAEEGKPPSTCSTCGDATDGSTIPYILVDGKMICPQCKRVLAGGGQP